MGSTGLTLADLPNIFIMIGALVALFAMLVILLKNMEVIGIVGEGRDDPWPRTIQPPRLMMQRVHIPFTFKLKENEPIEYNGEESLRIFPPVGFLARKSTAKYTFPGTNVTIDEGTGLIMSIHAIQNDEQYFKNADEFIPDRFHPDNAKNIHKFTYLPFGEGSRACIGERMGQMQALAGVATVLSRFSVTPSPRTVRTPRIDPTSTVVSSIAEGLPLMISRRHKD